MRITFDGSIMIENGDVIEVLRGIVSGDGQIRATKIRNITKGGWVKMSRVDGTLMTVMPREFTPPLRGKVRSLAFPGSDTEFDLVQGDFAEDHIFIPAGSKAKAMEILGKILKNELVEFVKICDPFINEATFLILRNVPDNVAIFVLYEKPGGKADETTVKKCVEELTELGKTVRIKRRRNLFHSRYILTRGTGWAIGHSLKDVGDKDTTIDKMRMSKDVEDEFDKHWAADKEENNTPSI